MASKARHDGSCYRTCNVSAVVLILKPHQFDILETVIDYIPTGSMLPQRRMHNLLDHARAYQRSSCLYHDPRAPFSLYEDHECSRARFPTLTTYVLMEHDDEVWNIAWSHDGRYLASASKDRTAVIWKVPVRDQYITGRADATMLTERFPVLMFRWVGSSQQPESEQGRDRDCSVHRILRDHKYGVTLLAWSADDSILITGSEQHLKMWNTEVRTCSITS